jgi:ribonuclease D
LYTSPPDYVRTQDELGAAIAKLSASNFVALDTEFLRERTYFAKLCLIQAGNDTSCVLIDVLEPLDLRPLFAFLDNPQLTKILHAAHQDLEVFAFANGELTGTNVAPISGPIFDTQVAAGFSGLTAQLGYADLVRLRLNHSLDKAQTRTDWSQRPLSQEQIEYAADDVRYLVDLYHDFQRTLAGTKHSEWMMQDAQEWTDPARFMTDPDEAWRRIRGIDQLAPSQQAAAKTLAAWRERRAIEKNLPRSWILADSVLRQLSEQLPKTIDDLATIRDLPQSTVSKRGQEFLEMIAAATASVSDESHTPWTRPPRSQLNKVTKLLEFVRAEAQRIQISAELLTTRREMEQWVFNGTLGDFAYGWRRAVFGEKLIKLSTDE